VQLDPVGSSNAKTYSGDETGRERYAPLGDRGGYANAHRSLWTGCAVASKRGVGLARAGHWDANYYAPALVFVAHHGVGVADDLLERG
jgi:hypothetical protein